MNAVSKEVSGEKERLHLLRAGDQSLLAVLLLAALLLVVGRWCWSGGPQGRLVDPDRVSARQYEFRVDVNRADWPELALLPGVGETLAQRIVAYRNRRGDFTHLTQLQQVHGIGPRTLGRIKPYLAELPTARPSS